MKSSFVILLLLHCGMPVDLVRQYTLVSKSMNWFEAQSYCRQKFTDLATITTDEEQNKLGDFAVWQSFYGWIGLKRTRPTSSTWQWSDGQTPTFYKWFYDPTKYQITDDCVVLSPSGWTINDCSGTYYFICYTALTLVKENKTWEEALDYCRTNHTALASPIPNPRVLLNERTADPAQNISVWTGLRFIDGKWMWGSGQKASSMFPSDLCPASPHRCGAHNFNKRVLENRDCNEKLNFLCY